jgi:hypothetical protein
MFGATVPSVGARGRQLRGLHNLGAVQGIAAQLTRLGITPDKLAGSFHSELPWPRRAMLALILQSSAISAGGAMRVRVAKLYDRTLTSGASRRIFPVSSTARRCFSSMTPPGMFGVAGPLGIGSDPLQSKQ